MGLPLAWLRRKGVWRTAECPLLGWRSCSSSGPRSFRAKKRARYKSSSIILLALYCSSLCTCTWNLPSFIHPLYTGTACLWLPFCVQIHRAAKAMHTHRAFNLRLFAFQPENFKSFKLCCVDVHVSYFTCSCNIIAQTATLHGRTLLICS